MEVLLPLLWIPPVGTSSGTMGRISLYVPEYVISVGPPGDDDQEDTVVSLSLSSNVTCVTNGLVLVVSGSGV